MKGELAGPAGTPYEGGQFVLDIKIPDTYPFAPPVIKFETSVLSYTAGIRHLSSHTPNCPRQYCRDSAVPAMPGTARAPPRQYSTSHARHCPRHCSYGRVSHARKCPRPRGDSPARPRRWVA
ncbi:hypothetical protein AMAG_06446 [Allomyces macrogynus ATCC 38327]|uniref:UBC core domain-containing protein n=1 Tax=Allomyces macrogynus (strain ATCC 38327) TaxID=578462 RepID=A0A0L0SGJ4_ALLM3|nr:hypothetical protein AMAG_06446 [Allomyces macrogynus ATCC 38327]|eukprot:KNE61636.1 hypothetical protein AMAG_06446 [Allomyces macrogynus ATCC 38327]